MMSAMRPPSTVMVWWCLSDMVEGSEMICFCFMENNDRKDAISKLIECVFSKRQIDNVKINGSYSS